MVYICFQDIEYEVIRMNVNKLKLIQIGISLSDSQGNVPEKIST